MFRVIVDGDEIGSFNRLSYAKKQADLFLSLGGYSAWIYRYRKPYSYRRFNTKWQRTGIA